MTNATFDRATYGRMTTTDLAAQFERIVGEPPEKRNRLWMLKRMEQAFSAREAAHRAVERAAGGGEGDDEATLAHVEPAPVVEGDAAEAAPGPTVANVEAAAGAIADDPVPCGASSVAEEATAEAPLPVENGEALVTGDDDNDQGDEAEEGPSAIAPHGAPPRADADPLRRRYIPLRFRFMSLSDIHALYAATVGRPTKSVDVPYLAWKIKRAEQHAGTAPAPHRRTSVGADGASRGEAKAVTLREYPDTLAALEGVCQRHGFRNRLDFFRTAARLYLEQVGEPEAAAYFGALVGEQRESASAS